MALIRMTYFEMVKKKKKYFEEIFVNQRTNRNSFTKKQNKLEPKKMPNYTLKGFLYFVLNKKTTVYGEDKD